MEFSVVIPARYGSTRLPAKLLLELAGQPLISHAVARANESSATRVIVATDDTRIAEALINARCDVIMTSENHQSGSDRLAEVVQKVGFPGDHIVVNVQGDEPAIPGRLIDEVANCLAGTEQAVMATAAQAIKGEDDLHNPNIVKVVTDQTHRALYFSRAPIPHVQAGGVSNQALHHIGIYAYRAEFLNRYANLQPSLIEQDERLEQLRVLDNGESIMVHTIDYDAGIGIDTAADLERARQALELSTN